MTNLPARFSDVRSPRLITILDSMLRQVEKVHPRFVAPKPEPRPLLDDPTSTWTREVAPVGFFGQMAEYNGANVLVRAPRGSLNLERINLVERPIVAIAHEPDVVLSPSIPRKGDKARAKSLASNRVNRRGPGQFI